MPVGWVAGRPFNGPAEVEQCEESLRKATEVCRVLMSRIKEHTTGKAFVVQTEILPRVPDTGDELDGNLNVSLNTTTGVVTKKTSSSTSQGTTSVFLEEIWQAFVKGHLLASHKHPHFANVRRICFVPEGRKVCGKPYTDVTVVIDLDYVKGKRLGDVSKECKTFEELKPVLEKLRVWVVEARDKYGLIHGDPHGHNFKYSTDGVVVALDYDSIREQETLDPAAGVHALKALFLLCQQDLIADEDMDLSDVWKSWAEADCMALLEYMYGLYAQIDKKAPGKLTWPDDMAVTSQCGFHSQFRHLYRSIQERK